MAVEDAFDEDADFGPGAFAVLPVNGDGFADLLDEFGGDDFEFVVDHGFFGAVVGGEGVVEGDFFVVESKIFAALRGGVEVFGEFNELRRSLKAGIFLALFGRELLVGGEDDAGRH